MQPTTESLLAFRGAGRLAYRKGQFAGDAAKTMRVIVNRPLTTEERQAIVDGWTAERREVCS